MAPLPTARHCLKVWEDFDDFKALATKLKDTSAKAAGAAEQGKGTFTAAFNDMTKVLQTVRRLLSGRGIAASAYAAQFLGGIRPGLAGSTGTRKIPIRER